VARGGAGFSPLNSQEMTTKLSLPHSGPKIEISGTISYNLLESVPISFFTTASPFADTMWKALCDYCESHCVAYMISYMVDGKSIDYRLEKEYLIGGGDVLN
jgi:hypothetical protein